MALLIVKRKKKVVSHLGLTIIYAQILYVIIKIKLLKMKIIFS